MAETHPGPHAGRWSARLEAFLDRHPFGGWLLLYLALVATSAGAGILQVLRPESLVLTGVAVVGLVVVSAALILAWAVPRLRAPAPGRRVPTVAFALVMAAGTAWNAGRIADARDDPLSVLEVQRCLHDFSLRVDAEQPVVGRGAPVPLDASVVLTVVDADDTPPGGGDFFGGSDTIVVASRALLPVETAAVNHCQDPDR